MGSPLSDQTLRCLRSEDRRPGLTSVRTLVVASPFPHPHSLSCCGHKMNFLVAQSANLVTEGRGMPGVLHDWPVSSISLGTAASPQPRCGGGWVGYVADTAPALSTMLVLWHLTHLGLFMNFIDSM